MTMHQKQRLKQLKDGLEELNRAVDAHADKNLDELRKSKWTGAWVLLAIAVLTALVGGLIYLLV